MLIKAARRSAKRSWRTIRDRVIRPVILRGRTRYFCVGLGKTGTTSLAQAFRDLGFVVGDQRSAERLLPQYRDGDWDALVRYCRSAEVFQDFPFGYPETYRRMDQAFPGSRFILTVRDSPEQWYESLTAHHARIWGHGRVPSRQDLRDAEYVWKGWALEARELRGLGPDEDPYDRDRLIRTYVEHNREVIGHFAGREESLLVLNLAEADAYRRFVDFLGVESPHSSFPWLNRTSEKVVRA